MPIYEYACEECGKTTETLRRMSEADEAIKCEHCGSGKTRRAHSVFAAGGTSAGTGTSGHAHGPSCGCCCGGGACGID